MFDDYNKEERDPEVTRVTYYAKREKNENEEKKEKDSGSIRPEYPHRNYLLLSILCTVCCCILGGIFAIIYSIKSNSAYSTAMFASDPGMKEAFYMESERYNRIVKNLLIISVIVCLIGSVTSLSLRTSGLLALPFMNS